MEVTETFKAADRADWRQWLERHHGTAREIWLLLDDSPDSASGMTYLDAVEEALCFGWVDSTAKRYSASERAQRFSPRRRHSNWTELNKARARRLIALGLMAEAGRAALPDLDAPLTIAPDIIEAFTAAGAWTTFSGYPELYRRIRIGYVEDARKDRVEFARRLRVLVDKTAQKKMFGNWNDDGRLSE